MKHHLGARAVAAVAASALSLVTLATAASAEGDVAVLTVGPAGVLTLPAGDGVRDQTTVAVASDVATSATAMVRAAEGEEPVLVLDPVEVGPDAPATVTVPVAPLAAGAYELVVTPTLGEPVVTPVTVGSGDPVEVSLGLSATTIFSWSGATPNASTATVSATDETGLKVPFTGTMVAVVGGKSVTASVAAATAKAVSAKIPAATLGAGTGTVTATLVGPSEIPSSASASLRVVKTAVTGVALTSSLATVFPVKDSYRDTVKLTVAPKTTRDASFPATGSVKIRHNGTVIKSWALTSSAKKTLTWDGRNGGKVVPGTYKATVTIKGPEGSSRSASTYVTVSGKKLVTKTLSKTYNASAVITEYEAFDYYYDGECFKNALVYGDIYCDAYDAYDLDIVALVATGRLTVPTEVVGAQKFGGASVKLSATWQYLYGDSAWSYGREMYGVAVGNDTKLGKQTLGALRLPATSKAVHVTLWLGEYATASATNFTATYTYKKLVN